ncbi:hypothetical protein CJF31_00005161 [Rutstroemia sp. NJR-2017a BVV2]|nr:hypothetical protein CJF31_00005161 [Rutstroemia sp. NJR-2017a BVV2]
MVNIPRMFLRYQQSPANHLESSDSSAYSSSTTSSHLSLTPIHEKPTLPRRQLLSPFYSGILPAEIRTLIFTYALTPTAHPIIPAYDPNTNFCRPGDTHPIKVHTALLSTCRRIYHETYHLPAHLFPHRFYCFREPAGLSTRLFNNPDAYFARFQPWQCALVTRVTFSTQMFWLEDRFPSVCANRYLQHVTELKIVIRRGDWWWNERNERLAIDPYRGKGQDFDEVQDYMRKPVGERSWQERRWGAALERLGRLRVLEMEFETSEDKRAELERVVEWARSWEFPMGERGVLSMRKVERKRKRDQRDMGPVEYEEVRSWEWRGKTVHWSEQCPYCRSHSCRNSLEKCREKSELKRRGKGPMLLVKCCKWTLMAGEPKVVDEKA